MYPHTHGLQCSTYSILASWHRWKSEALQRRPCPILWHVFIKHEWPKPKAGLLAWPNSHVAEAIRPGGASFRVDKEPLVSCWGARLGRGGTAAQAKQIVNLLLRGLEFKGDKNDIKYAHPYQGLGARQKCWTLESQKVSNTSGLRSQVFLYYQTWRFGHVPLIRHKAQSTHTHIQFRESHDNPD